jgi:Asp-tRNA(Asn)/Glu-tRNA(Gln) amidotransferase A subunit family amidase
VTALPAGVEAVRRALDRALSLQPEIHAFADITAERAAAEADAHRGALAGVPVAVKDVIDVAGVPTRLGTPRAGHRLPPDDADVVAALRAAGAVVIGKTTTHELAIGMITPQARNPRDPSRITGGSSGGSAAAVAAGVVPIALGTDTNGSIRSPAAHCGVVGFKPTRGVLSTAGVAPLAPTQDTVGLIAARMSSLMAAWRVVAGGKSAPAAAPARAGSRVGFARAASAAAAEPVADAVAQSVRRLVAADIEVVDVELPDRELVRAASLLVILREAADAWNGLVEREGDGLTAEVRATLRSAATVTRAAYRNAKRVRLQVCSALASLDVDAILLPTVPVTATLAGAERVELHGRMRSVEALQSEYTALASLTGQPAISLPCGADQDDLPIGLQLLGKGGADDQLLDLAFRAEQAFV